MTGKVKYDIFISYRRDGGEQTAALLYSVLSQRGYRVAYDIESLKAGVFDEQILSIIRNCKDVIVVLGPNALDRCVNPDDWVRLEIACALQSNRNIVPVLLRGFSFPDPATLPEDIRDFLRHNGVGASMEHLESTVDRICERLNARSVQKFRKAVIAGFFAVAALALAGVGIKYGIDAPRRSKIALQRESEVIAKVMKIGTAYELLVEARTTFHKDVKNAIEEKNKAAFDLACEKFRRAMDQVNAESLKPEASFLSMTETTNVERAEVSALWDELMLLVENSKGNLDTLRPFFDRFSSSDMTRLRNLAETHESSNEIFAEGFATRVVATFRNVDAARLADFKRECVPHWHILSKFMQEPWPTDESENMNRIKAADERLTLICNELGNMAARFDGEIEVLAAMMGKFDETTLITVYEITEVAHDSNGEKRNLMPGDVICKFGDYSIAQPQNEALLDKAIEELRDKEKTLVVARKAEGKHKILSIDFPAGSMGIAMNVKKITFGEYKMVVNASREMKTSSPGVTAGTSDPTK